MKYRVILFQPYLRQFFLNFGAHLQNFTLENTSKPPMLGGGYDRLPTFQKEILRRKDHWRNRLRRILGIPNVRFYFSEKGDVLFTYGCLIVTNKPYCTYIENGLALFNYDLRISRNPVAWAIAVFLMTRKNCKRLIFMSEASRKSFYSTVWYPTKVLKILQSKSIVIYPIPFPEMRSSVTPKIFTGSLRFLFPGQFYIKGGLEVMDAYERLQKQYSNVSLTIITPLHMLRSEDREHLKQIPGLTLLDATLSSEEMSAMYTSHDILLLPTYREGFGMVLVEAISYGLPLIITDQYATTEMTQRGKNAFVYPNHPLKDYDQHTYRNLGKYYNPKNFYTDFFRYKKEGALKHIEDFLFASMENFLLNPELLESYSRESLILYEERFDAKKISLQMEAVFLEALKN